MSDQHTGGGRQRDKLAERIDGYLRAAALGGAILLILSQLLLRVPQIRTLLVPHERVEGIPYQAG
ncbi:hypothetical protein [Cohnella sp. JJ-181]|uniref:hypothetical protein n=1 Tax=Cohnella rhizoplanae TaxID=2974897 RepID=UPI0022FF8E04|nr:hypothetical protein [Cohnella sp. JJ-181]CAI6057920.1 hypothetical protein COHCIP112018_01755 [Cohnella sp. JJ-181]